MKKLISIITITTLSITALVAQIKEKRNITGFNGVTASGIIEVELIQGDEYSVEVEAPEGKIEKIKTELSGNTLLISAPYKWGKENPKAYITMPKIEKIKASGVSEVYSKGLLKSDELTIIVHGASEIKLSVKTIKLNTSASGVSELKLRGYTEEQILVSNGASEVDAEDLITLRSTVTVSGTSSVGVYVTEEINGSVSGASDLDITGNPASNNIKKSGVASIDGINAQNSNNNQDLFDQSDNDIYRDNHNEDVEIKNDIVGDVIVQEHGDTTRISIGNKKILIIEGDDDTKFGLDLKDSTSKPWTYGIDGMILGVNGFLNSSNQLDLPESHEFLELDIARSINFQFNLLDANINLYKEYITFHPGLGLEFNSYEFRKNYWISPSSESNSEITALQSYKADSSTLKFEKNRLKGTYLNVPIMFGFHTNEDHKKAFHLGIGGYAGLKLASKMKYKYRLDGEGRKEKIKDDYYLNPFRYGVMASIGYSNINIFANYALSGLFEDNKGPQLSPFSVGLMIVGF